MNAVLILEDNEAVGRGITQEISQAAERHIVRVKWIDYLGSYGTPKSVERVATAVFNECGAERTVLFVDLAPEIHQNPPSTEFGLRVIRAVAKEFGREDDLIGFLMDPNFLVVIMTMHGLKHAELAEQWGVTPDEVTIVRVHNEENLNQALTQHSVHPTLPLIDKGQGTHWIKRVVTRWLELDPEA